MHKVNHIARTLVVLLMAAHAQLGPAVQAQQQADRTIEIHAHRFSFEPSEITLKRNETVQLRLISDDVTHQLSVPDLGISQEIKKGKPIEITVTPTTDGDFHGQCAHFCGSGHGSMLFVVHVKE
jgi:cytochrome c oxidase subunit 2